MKRAECDTALSDLPVNVLEGKVCAVTGAEYELGAGLAIGLANAGAAVALLGDARGLAKVAADLGANGASAAAVQCDFSTRAAVEEAWAVIPDVLGSPIKGVVHAWMPSVAYEVNELVTVNDEHWAEVWEGALNATRYVLQSAFAHFGDGDSEPAGGRIVVVTPTVSMSGAVGLVPYTTAIEGMRLLAKSAARQWGPDAITVNCLAPAPEQVPIGVLSMAVSLAPPALGGPGDVENDLGPIAAFLLSDAAHGLTGATLCADGGVWMAP